MPTWIASATGIYSSLGLFTTGGREFALSEARAGPRSALFILASLPPPVYTWSRSLALMILPQVHLRKPCYDFYFL